MEGGNKPFLKGGQDDVMESWSWHIVDAQTVLVSSLLHWNYKIQDTNDEDRLVALSA